MSHVTHVTVSRCHSVTLSLCHGGLTASLLIVCNVLGKPNICLLLEKFSGLEIRSSQYVHRSYSSVRELLSQSPLCSAANQCTNTKNTYSIPSNNSFRRVRGIIASRSESL